MRTSPRNHILEHLVPSQWCYLGSCYGPTEGITHLRVCLESLVQMPVGSLHFMLEVEDEISQLSVPAPQCHITPTIMDSPSGTIALINSLFCIGHRIISQQQKSSQYSYSEHCFLYFRITPTYSLNTKSNSFLPKVPYVFKVGSETILLPLCSFAAKL